MNVSSFLSGILYCEFDNVKGSSIVYQHPEKYISEEEYKKFSKFVLTGNKMCSKLIGFVFERRVFLGIPEYLMTTVKGREYTRNAFFFNVVLVFEFPGSEQEWWEKGDHFVSEIMVVFGPVLKKLMQSLSTLEYRKELLSDKPKDFFEQFVVFFEGIRTSGACKLEFDLTSNFHFKTLEFNVGEPPRKVHVHEVPYPLVDLSRTELRKNCDLALQKILPYIDGKSWLGEIALLSGVKFDIVAKVVQHLVFFGAVALLDLFQYSNVYALSAENGAFSELFRSDEAKKECLEFFRDSIKVPDLLRLYCQFDRSRPLRKVLANADHVNHRALVAFGLIKGFLVRVHEYPVLVESAKDLDNDVIPYLDGKHCLDQIMCVFSWARSETLRKLSRYPVLWSKEGENQGGGTSRKS